MNLCLDNIIFALQRSGGISVYWAELLKYFCATGVDFQVTEHPKALANIQRSALELPADRIVPDSRLPLNLSRYLSAQNRSNADIYHSSYYRTPQRNVSRQVVTVYDFTYELYRSGLRRAVHRHQKQQALHAAHGVICISESTKRDLLRLYPAIPESRARVIPLGVSKVFSPLAGDHKLPEYLSWLPAAEYAMFIGDRCDYKNFDLAVLTVSREQDLQLAIVGGGPLSAAEQHLLNTHLPGRYRHLHGIDETALNVLYNHAFCLLYPSSYEGFGLPPLEAMRAGCPVIAVNCSSLPEVCGDAALLAGSANVEEFAELLKILRQEQMRHAVIAKGRLQADKFTWEHTGQQTMAFYHALT